MVFTSVVLGALGGLMTPALRAVLSKVVHCGEVRPNLMLFLKLFEMTVLNLYNSPTFNFIQEASRAN